jgi:hypothetical protein
MTRKYLLALLVLLTATFSSANAQGYLYATGSPIYSTSLPIDRGIVNVNNGDIHLEIPLATKQQRGSLSLNEKLVYDSRNLEDRAEWQQLLLAANQCSE